MKSYKWSLLLVLCAAAGWLAFTQLGRKAGHQLDKIKLPAGFKIELFAENVTNARSMCLTPSGTLFVGTRDEGSVYALVDQNGDHKATRCIPSQKDCRCLTGLHSRWPQVVAEVSKIWRFDRIEQNLTNPPKPVLITDKYRTRRTMAGSTLLLDRMVNSMCR